MTKPQGPSIFDWFMFLFSAHNGYKLAAEPQVIFPVFIMLICGAMILIKLQMLELHQALEAKKKEKANGQE